MTWETKRSISRSNGQGNDTNYLSKSKPRQFRPLLSLRSPITQHMRSA